MNEYRAEYERQERMRRGGRCLGCLLLILSGVVMAFLAWAVYVALVVVFG